MAGEWAATGDLAMAGLTVQAAEPHGDPHGGGAGGLCLNCGTRRAGEFCQACGQSAHVHRSFGAIGHELAHGVFHFEGRIWRTLPLLLFRPGELTRRYARGERARFVSPMALFLFIIFVLFAMLSVVGAHLETPGAGRTSAARAPLERAIADNGEQVARLTAERARTTDADAITRLDGQITERQRDTAAITTTLKVMKPDGISQLEKIHTGWKRLDKGIAKAAENPNLMLYKLQSNAYKFAWALIPFSLPFMWLLFPFSRRFTMYDHAVFVTYSLCFVSLFGMVASLLGMAGVPGGWLFLAIVTLVPLHMYKQLRGAYGCGRIGAGIRMTLLFVGANIALTAFVTLLLGMGLVG